MEKDYERISIVDPLYELSVFRLEGEKDIYSEIFGGEEEFGRLYERLMNSFEINRLNFLKQAGLLYLIFPSATHTRFSHSLGCFILGSYALENIWVKEGKHTIKLEQYLKRRKLIEEFLIALLVHDIGHLPFSHYLEGSQFVKDTFKDHENITMNFLTEDSNLYKMLLKHAEISKTETIVQIVKEIKFLDIEKIQKLLEEENTDPASQLVCGYLDLDRLDHYFRDSFFMGLKLASVNIKGFLDAIVIDADPEEPKFFLREEGIPNVLHLLFGRELLWQRAFDSNLNRAYESMCVRALDNWLEKNSDKILELPFMTEEQLIYNLMDCENSKKIFEKILSRRPYSMMYKGITNLSKKKILKIYNEWLKKEANDPDDFLIFIPRNYEKDAGIKEWLLSDIPILEGKTLRQVHDELFSYFQRQNEMRAKTIRIFARDNKLAQDKKKSFESYLENEA